MSYPEGPRPLQHSPPHRGESEPLTLTCAGCGKIVSPERAHRTPEFKGFVTPISFNWWALPPGWLVFGSRDHDESEVYACSPECADAADRANAPMRGT